MLLYSDTVSTHDPAANISTQGGTRFNPSNPAIVSTGPSPPHKNSDGKTIDMLAVAGSFFYDL